MNIIINKRTVVKKYYHSNITIASMLCFNIVKFDQVANIIYSPACYYMCSTKHYNGNQQNASKNIHKNK